MATLLDATQDPCPFERVKAITAIGRQSGTLPGSLALKRLAALHEARRLTDTVAELARKVGMRRSRVSTLLNTAGCPAGRTPSIKEIQPPC